MLCVENFSTRRGTGQRRSGQLGPEEEKEVGRVVEEEGKEVGPEKRKGFREEERVLF
jgi:hypothetical protein